MEEDNHMEVIGEKINGTRKEVGEAVANRDAHFIQELARRQVNAGSTYLDVNAGTGASESDDLSWLVETVQSVVDVPLCLDSPNPQALQAAIPLCCKMPMVNSISGESHRLENVLPVVAELGCPVVALAADDTGISQDLAGRLSVVEKVMQATRAAGVSDDRVYVDPLVIPVATFDQSGAVSLEAMREVKRRFPLAKLCVGLSNLSFGLPARSLINRVFIALSIQAGLDAALVNPEDSNLMQEILAAELVLGLDANCRRYTVAYREAKHGFPGLVKKSVEPAISQTSA
jgi:5-methyltetrahydrofolate--homocysteine methyltransferase